MPKRIDWTRDEVILALDLYFRHNPSHISRNHSGVKELSNLLNSTEARKSLSDSTHRNPNGVYSKLCNFLHLDPDYAGAGRSHVSKTDRTIWEEFGNDRESLVREATAIRARIAARKIRADRPSESFVLKPLVKYSDIARAVDILSKQLKAGAEIHNQSLGWQGGGSDDCKIAWQPDCGMWSFITDRDNVRNYWCVFGNESPAERRSLSIVCEVNSPKQGFDRQSAGLFAIDNEGTVYLAHSGRVGGGRKGVGKSTFMRFYRGQNFAEVQWPDNKRTEVIVLGALSSKYLLQNISNFVQEVARFKGFAKGDLPEEPDDSFSPEYQNPRKPYTHPGVIEAKSIHATVVNQLARELQDRGYSPANDQRDLYLRGAHGHLRVLFEVKSDTSTTQIYEAIGQLLYYSATDKPRPKLIAVLPDSLKKESNNRLRRLGIKVLPFTWHGQVVVFEGLDQVLKELR